MTDRPSDDELKRRVAALNSSRLTEDQIHAEIARLQGLLNGKQAQTERAEAAGDKGNEAGEATGAEVQAEPSQPEQPVSITPQPAEADKARRDVETVRETASLERLPLQPVVIQQQNSQIIVEADGTLSRTHAEAELRMETTLEVCRRIAEGESLRKISQDPDMPSAGTFLRWCHDDAELGQMYTVALRIRAANMAEELVELADKAEKAIDAAQVQGLKLMVNTRQWVASRLLPKQYGDHQIVEHTGEVKLDEKQVDARLTHLLKRIQLTK